MYATATLVDVLSDSSMELHVRTGDGTSTTYCGMRLHRSDVEVMWVGPREYVPLSGVCADCIKAMDEEDEWLAASSHPSYWSNPTT